MRKQGAATSRKKDGKKPLEEREVVALRYAVSEISI